MAMPRYCLSLPKKFSIRSRDLRLAVWLGVGEQEVSAGQVAVSIQVEPRAVLPRPAAHAQTVARQAREDARLRACRMASASIIQAVRSNCTVKLKQLPSRGVLVTCTSPPINLTSRATIVRPSPVPP